MQGTGNVIIILLTFLSLIFIVFNEYIMLFSTGVGVC